MSTEFQLINKYFYKVLDDSSDVKCGIGDDAAIVSFPAGMEMAVSMDTLVDGIHFLPGARADDIGYKSLAVNLSDMAAMGAKPCWVSLSLTMPENDETWLQQFVTGFSSLAREYSLSLIGGDLTHGPLSVTIQVHGQVPEGQAIYRRGASPGDLVFVSGTLGDAAYALDLLQDRANCSEEIRHKVLPRLQRPVPRVGLGQALRGVASSAIDISDGLLSDLEHILHASHVAANINVYEIPLSNALNNCPDAMDYALAGGDDYELCFTVPPGKRSELMVLAEKHPVTCIGEVTEGNGIRWLNFDGSDYTPAQEAYSHF